MGRILPRPFIHHPLTIGPFFPLHCLRVLVMRRDSLMGRTVGGIGDPQVDQIWSGDQPAFADTRQRSRHLDGPPSANVQSKHLPFFEDTEPPRRLCTTRNTRGPPAVLDVPVTLSFNAHGEAKEKDVRSRLHILGSTSTRPTNPIEPAGTGSPTECSERHCESEPQ